MDKTGPTQKIHDLRLRTGKKKVEGLYHLRCKNKGADLHFITHYADSMLFFSLKTFLDLGLVVQNFVSLSPSHTEHTAYTVGHPCKPYIQPNKPWPYPTYTRAIRVYPCKPCMIFKTFKKTGTGAMSVYNHISDRTKP